MNVDWLFFDVGGPLAIDTVAFNNRVDTCLKVLKQFIPSLTRKQILDLWPEASVQIGALEKSLAKLLITDEKNANQAYKLISEEKAKQPSYLESVTIRPDAADVCAQLSKRYKLGIIANQSPLIKPKLLEAGVLQHFTHQKVSGDYGLEKPNPELYLRILQETDANPTRSVMIDDNIERSLMPAKKLGMKTVWYKLDDRTTTPPNSIDFTIQKLEDLLRLFL